MSGIVRLDAAFHQGRVAAVQAALAETPLAGLLVLNASNVIYLSGFYHIPSERPIGVFVPRAGDPILFIPLLEQENAAESWIGDVRAYFEFPGETHPVAWMLREAAASGRIGVDQLTLAVHQALTGVEVVSNAIVEQLRWIKTPEEIVLIETAAHYADLALEYLIAHAAAMIGAEATELDLLAACVGSASARLSAEVGALFKLGGSAVVGTVHSGARAALPHGSPGHRRPQRGDAMIAGIGAAVGGYHAESGATFILGEPTDDQWHCLRAAAACNDAGIAALKVGATCASVNEAALAELRDAGLSEFIRHRIGHGMGLEAHESPWLAPGDATRVQAGMVFSNEPGIYRPGVDGYRTINTMIVTEQGVHIPSRFLAEHGPEQRVIAL